MDYNLNDMINTIAKSTDERRVDVCNSIIKAIEEIADSGAYEQAVNGKTEYLKGISYSLDTIAKYLEEVEK